jgi:7-carboxy-7-deazaguanine synthase
MDWRNLDRLREMDEVKFVLKDRADFDWSARLVKERALAARCTVLFSPVHGVLAPGLLAQWILEDGVPARLQVQLHKYLWPGLERGV